VTYAEIAARLRSLADEIDRPPESIPDPQPEALLDDELYQIPGQDAIWRVKDGVRWHIDGAEWASLGYVAPLLVDAGMLARVPIRGDTAPIPPPAPAPKPERTGPEPIIGINVQPSTAWQSLPFLVDLGIKHVRVSFREPDTPGDWAWLPAYREAGIEVLPMLDPRRDGYRSAWRLLRSAFGAGAFPFVQLGNEGDGVGNANRGGGEYAGRLMLEVADEIHSTGTKIVAQGLGWTQPGVHQYLRAMIETAGHAVDVFANHAYGHNPTWEPMSRATFARQYGWQGPVWGTEIGLRGPDAREFLGGHYRREPTDEEMLRYHAEVWGDILTHADRLLYERIYLFQLTPDDEVARAHGLPFYCSALDGAWKPRPAYHVLRERAK
jgi:hypothetical protein